MKWQNDQFDTWVFLNDNKTDTWFEFFNNQVLNILTKISIDYDKTNGYPTVVLKRNENYFIKLSERFLYWGENLTYFANYSSGYWTKRVGKKDKIN